MSDYFTVVDLVHALEDVGVKFSLNDQKDGLRIRFCNKKHREDLAEWRAIIRAHRDEVLEYVRTRYMVPDMPEGVNLVCWDLKDSPVAVETTTVVIDPSQFARMTLDQLQCALQDPEHWNGWTVEQLLDRLAQAGAIVALERR